MPKAEWASKMAMNHKQQIQDRYNARYNLALKLHAERMIARMNREAIDLDKVIFDPDTRTWRLLTDEEKLANQMARAEITKKSEVPADNV